MLLDSTMLENERGFFPWKLEGKLCFIRFRARIFEILGALSFVYFDLLRKIDNNFNLNESLKNVFGNLKKENHGHISIIFNKRSAITSHRGTSIFSATSIFFLSFFFFLIETRPVEGIERGDKLTRVSHDASFPSLSRPSCCSTTISFHSSATDSSLVKRIDRVKPGPSLLVFPPFGETFRSMDGV